VPKFFIYWEVASTFVPGTPEERAKLWLTLSEMVKADLEAGIIKDWGIRVGELSGYGICEMSEEDLNNLLMKWLPYIKFEVNPVITIDQQIEGLKKYSEMMKK